MATDRRTKYTKSVIRQALFDLLKEKPLNKITVTDICKMADINRSTFYSYYEDVYALLTQIQNELFENIVLTLANDNWFNDILHLIDQNRDLCQVLIGPHGDSSFIRQLMYLGYDNSMRVWQKFIRMRMQRCWTTPMHIWQMESSASWKTGCAVIINFLLSRLVNC